MRTRMLVTLAAIFVMVNAIGAQPKEDPFKPLEDFLKRQKFDPQKLREAIAFPISHTQIGIRVDQPDADELPPIAVIEKKLRGDERDAEWLLKLGYQCQKSNPDRARDAFEKAAAAFRKRID